MTDEQRREDEDEFRREHLRIFGHHPIPDVLSGNRCVHPMHRSLRRTIDAPGVLIALDFPFQDVRREDFLTDDEEEVGHDA